jgi:hypothetical protein
MDKMIALLLTWLSANSPYDTRNIVPPTVVVMSAEELTKEAYSRVPMLIPPDGVDERYLALYSFDDGPHGTIYVLDPKIADPELAADKFYDPYQDPIFQEKILHELVHHLQRRSGVYHTYQCQAQGEEEAYRLGGRYLRQLHTEDPLPNRNFRARIYSRC